MATVGVAQGAVAEFDVRQNYGILPDGDTWVCKDVATRGQFVHESAAGECALVSGAMPATVHYLGFLEQDVVADIDPRIEFGYQAQQKIANVQDGEKVAVHRIGRFLVTAVSGSVSAAGKVYPGNDGKVQGVQVGSAPAIGVCVEGNSSAGDPIVVEINLIGRLSL